MLHGLGLDEAEIAALRKGGTISREARGRGCSVFKLRFRLQGRQRVKYLGTDEAVVTRVREALAELQAPRRRGRQLQQMKRQARAVLRATKRHLEAPLEDGGLKFHGLAIRRSRPK